MLGQEDPLEEGRVTHSRTLPGKPHGQRRLAGYNPWGHKELDITEHTLTHIHTHIYTKGNKKTLNGVSRDRCRTGSGD